MAWVDPPTFVDGDPLPASDLNQYVTANTNYLKGIADGVSFSGVQLGIGSTQSIPDTSDTDVTWSSEAFDYDGWWSSGATITVPAGAIPAGYTTIIVEVVAAIRFVTNATGGRAIKVLHNGTSVDAIYLGALTGDPTVAMATTFFTAAAGDTIKVQGRQNSGGALNIDYGKATVFRLAPVS